jgi:glycosyltransferase involved in cell wall biosynthesis
MQMDLPLVSVIIPVFNGEKFLEEAITSVLRQEYSPLEIVIVDDGSTDRTEQIAQGCGHGIRYLRQPNSGPSAARNRGLKIARGSMIAFLDADDVWPSGKLNFQLPYLINNPSLEIVMGRIQLMRLSGTIEGPVFEDFGEPCMSVNLGGAVFRRSVFYKVGLFDETMRYSEDVDWFMRAREGGVSIAVIDPVTLFYRLHDQNMTRERNLSDLHFFKALKKSLDRRRREGGVAAALPRLSDGDGQISDSQPVKS